MRDIKTVTVVGANGTMGTNVSGIFASFGNAKVYMVSRNLEKSRMAVGKACRAVHADSISRNLFPADFSMLSECVTNSDLVFESTVENLSIKKEVAAQIASFLRPGCIACTGASGLSINALAECFPDKLRGQFFGVHMFNPPYQMTLCELIASKYSNTDLLTDLKNYLTKVLYRTVVESKDKPAFLGNRIGFQLMNEAMQYAENYQDNGGIDYVDAILGTFTGRAMPPLTTVDFVGLDVHKAIVDNIYDNTQDFAHQTFILPKFAERLINEKKFGRKTGEGLYKLLRREDGSKYLMVYDIKTHIYRNIIQYNFPFAMAMREHLKNGEYQEAFKILINNHSREAEICLRFLLRYIVYSLYIARHVGYDLTACDDVMATGFKWCPPFAMIDAFSTVCDMTVLLRNTLQAEEFSHADISLILSEYQRSKYDFRTYFKAK